MTKPVSSVPNQFATATSTIPLSQLDGNFNAVTGYLNDLNNYSNYVADTGTANAIVLNYPSGITTTSIATGTQLQFQAANSNTDTSTLTVQVNASTILAAKTIYNEDGSTLSASEILAGGIYTVVYNGTNWILSGGGAGSGASAGGMIYENTQTLTSNYTITTGKNAMSTGPITIPSGITLTVPASSRYVIL
ncbi:hypothetical protein [Bacteriophage sp.]|nr:hypothetical protein [Bacteriophage sp.]